MDRKLKRKEWIDCTIPELELKKKRSKEMKWMEWGNTMIPWFIGLYVYYEYGFAVFSFWFGMIGILHFILLIEFANDVDRINHWIYIKRQEGVIWD